MTKLKDTYVLRGSATNESWKWPRRSKKKATRRRGRVGGQTQPSTRKENQEVLLGVEPSEYHQRHLILETSIRSKGGGRTGIQIKIGAGDFPRLLKQMTEADPEACLNSMLREIKHRELLLADRAMDEAYEKTVSHIKKEVVYQRSMAYFAYRKGTTKLREQKLRDAYALEDGIDRLVNKMKKKDVF